MLRIKVELVKWGDENLTEDLSTIYIVNNGSGTPLVGNYDIYTEDPRTPDGLSAWGGQIVGFRRQKYNSRDLTELAFEVLNDPECDYLDVSE